MGRIETKKLHNDASARGAHGCGRCSDASFMARTSFVRSLAAATVVTTNACGSANETGVTSVDAERPADMTSVDAERPADMTSVDAERPADMTSEDARDDDDVARPTAEVTGSLPREAHDVAALPLDPPEREASRLGWSFEAVTCPDTAPFMCPAKNASGWECRERACPPSCERVGCPERFRCIDCGSGAECAPADHACGR